MASIFVIILSHSFCDVQVLKKIKPTPIILKFKYIMMKQILLILITAAMLSSCGNSDQSKATKDAKEVQSTIKEMQPGGIPTKEGGWTMTAKINGKDWIANSIMPPDLAGRISGDNNGKSIGLPYDRRDMV